jgi:hypothetical protein
MHHGPQSTVTGIRTEVEALKREKAALQQELARAVVQTAQLQHMLDSSHSHLREVLMAVDAHSQLPEGLPEALMALTLEDEQMAIEAKAQGRSVNMQADVWAAALIGFKEVRHINSRELELPWHYASFVPQSVRE